ncbi:hypothetical protein [Nonomuraea sp. NPDC049141]|uniref:hypothetical protein n=1 Tax=Nonomuraea sp. NPDC049141 TaxID=3155500 RepID=UPI0033EC12BC
MRGVRLVQVGDGHVEVELLGRAVGPLRWLVVGDADGDQEECAQFDGAEVVGLDGGLAAQKAASAR